MNLAARRRHWSDPSLRRQLLPWAVVLVFAAVGYRSVLPPAPVTAEAPDTDFSAERAFAHVAEIAAEPHPMGSDAIAEVRTYLVAQLEELGVSVDLQAVAARDYFGDRGSIEVVNIIGRIPGTDSTAAVALMAHYDTVPTTPGANDNTTAVAALLETGRAILAGPPLRNDILLLFTDGEEPAPRYGATAFVAHNPAFRDIGIVVNLEASGGSGASLLAETSGPEGWLITGLAATDPHPAAFSLVTETSRLLGEFGTDFDAFHNAGVAGFHFAYLHGSPIYHTQDDNIDSVHTGSLQHHGTHALAIAQHFGDIDLSTSPQEDQKVYFTIRPFFIHYSANLAFPLAIIVVALFFLGAARRIDRSAIAATAASMGKTVGAGILATVAATVAWLGIVAIRPTVGIVESYLYFLAILAAAAYLAARMGARSSAADLGGPLLWTILAVLTALGLPGFSYAFAWPALGAAVAILWGTADGEAARLLRLCLVAAPALLLMTPAIDVFLQFAMPRPGNLDSQIPYTIAVPVLLGLLTIALVRTVWPNTEAGA